MIPLKRICDRPVAGDVFRVLVERLWPRGMIRERAKVDLAGGGSKYGSSEMVRS